MFCFLFDITQYNKMAFLSNTFFVNLYPFHSITQAVESKKIPSFRYFFKNAGVTRLELATSCVTGKRSNQTELHPQVILDFRF